MAEDDGSRQSLLPLVRYVKVVVYTMEKFDTLVQKHITCLGIQKQPAGLSTDQGMARPPLPPLQSNRFLPP